MRRVEGQLLHAPLPEVQQHGGVHHGHREAAQTVAVPRGEVLGRAAVVSLEEAVAEREGGGGGGGEGGWRRGRVEEVVEEREGGGRHINGVL